MNIEWVGELTREEYDLAEQELFEGPLSALLEAVDLARELRDEVYRNQFGFAPGEEPETLPEPPTPQLPPEVLGTETLPEPPEPVVSFEAEPLEFLPDLEVNRYADPEPYTPLSELHPDMRDWGHWATRMAARLDGYEPRYEGDVVPGFDRLEFLKGVADEWAMAEMEKVEHQFVEDGYGGIRENKRSHRVIGRITHWMNTGEWWDAIAGVEMANMGDGGGWSETEARLMLWLRLDELMADNDGKLDEYFLDYKLGMAQRSATPDKDML